jgi:hypothetical protein
MKKILSRHWSYIPTGLSLAAILIVFWFFNQSYLGAASSMVTQILENPFPTFGLIIFGAYSGAFISGEFSVKIPLTFEPLVMAVVGGFLAGVGAAIAGMSTNSVVLFNLAGVFTLPAFMITTGWIYVTFMILGGFTGSRLFVWAISKIPEVKRTIPVPGVLASKSNQRITFFALLIILVISVFVVLLLPQLNISTKLGLITAVLLLMLFGFVVERGTICMSSMLKEWFISRSAYVWRSVLFTIMFLALLYQTGLQLHLYESIVVEDYVQSPGFLILGSFLMGFGFIFADGCFIGSLWKAGEGNVINVIGIFGLLGGIGTAQLVKTIFLKKMTEHSSLISNHLTTILNPVVFLIILWLLGLLLLIVLKRKRYRY